jgi:hypothetical protein
VKRNNFATLNLTESLDNFKETVTKVLELSEVENWDGKTFLQKEQKIREAGLILAGECIALLLYNCNRSQDLKRYSQKWVTEVVG